VEIALVVCVLAAALGAVVLATRAARGLRASLLAALLVTTGIAAAALGPREEAPPAASRPKVGSPTYLGSNACRGCHPSEHASWSRTFHRTMTQDANAKTVLAPLDGSAGLERRGDLVYTTEGRGQLAHRVVLTTGSHREQAYWTAGKRPGELVLHPFVYLVREKKVLARKDAFVTPPDHPLNEAHWNSSCIACHAVAGEPGLDVRETEFETRVAELGIACEACHGPGAAHVEKQRDPFTRYAQQRKADPTIVNPKRVGAERSSAICGQCHSYAYPRDEDDWWTHGYARAFRPGDELARSRILLGPDVLGTPGAPRLDAETTSLFWSDGTIRVGGREYNGMVLSPCWKGEDKRKLGCLSCHAMHEGDPAGQIGPEKLGDNACNSCHLTTPEHSHHAVGTTSCVDCHMPKTSYALLSATRSHRIEIPDPATSADTGKPNGCNLCHLDRSLAWTGMAILRLYGRPPRYDFLPDEPVGVHDALSGDAAQRVLYADALASRSARAASKPGWQRAILRELAKDPYAAVRFVAERSLQADPPFLDGPPLVDEARMRVLLAGRDDRAVTIAE
jgi:hypothetical protein